MIRRLAIVVFGLAVGGVGALVGCELNHDIRRALDEVTRAACIQQLGACGQKRVYWNRCSHRVEIVDEDGEVREELRRAFEIAARPGVEQSVSSVNGAHVDAPKMTKAWRCKKRRGRMHCHLYNAAASVFGAFVQPGLHEPTSEDWHWRAPKLRSRKLTEA
jgi:hypothetical protein